MVTRKRLSLSLLIKGFLFITNKQEEEGRKMDKEKWKPGVLSVVLSMYQRVFLRRRALRVILT